MTSRFACSGASAPSFANARLRVHYTGELVAVDTFFVGALKGVGKVYLQTVLDCYSRHAWDVSTSKLPVTSVHVLNETVLPFFEAHEARVYTIPVGQRARVLRTS